MAIFTSEQTIEKNNLLLILLLLKGFFKIINCKYIYNFFLIKISKIFDEFKNLVKVSELNNNLVKYNGYKYYKDANKNLFVVQVNLYFSFFFFSFILTKVR